MNGYFIANDFGGLQAARDAEQRRQDQLAIENQRAAQAAQAEQARNAFNAMSLQSQIDSAGRDYAYKLSALDAQQRAQADAAQQDAFKFAMTRQDKQAADAAQQDRDTFNQDFANRQLALQQEKAGMPPKLDTHLIFSSAYEAAQKGLLPDNIDDIKISYPALSNQPDLLNTLHAKNQQALAANAGAFDEAGRIASLHNRKIQLINSGKPLTDPEVLGIDQALAPFRTKQGNLRPDVMSRLDLNPRGFLNPKAPTRGVLPIPGYDESRPAGDALKSIEEISSPGDYGGEAGPPTPLPVTPTPRFTTGYKNAVLPPIPTSVVPGVTGVDAGRSLPIYDPTVGELPPVYSPARVMRPYGGANAVLPSLASLIANAAPRAVSNPRPVSLPDVGRVAVRNSVTGQRGEISVDAIRQNGMPQGWELE